MGLVAGPGKAPLATTTMRSETLADINRGRLRGWTLVGAVGAYFLSILAWPELVATVGLAILGTALLVVGVWPRVALPDAEQAQQNA